eukprot:712295-Rhodomonas_salina.2
MSVLDRVERVRRGIEERSVPALVAPYARSVPHIAYFAPGPRQIVRATEKVAPFARSVPDMV